MELQNESGSDVIYEAQDGAGGGPDPVDYYTSNDITLVCIDVGCAGSLKNGEKVAVPQIQQKTMPISIRVFEDKGAYPPTDPPDVVETKKSPKKLYYLEKSAGKFILTEL